MPLVGTSTRVMEAGAKTGMTLAEVEELCVAAREADAPDDARFGTDLAVSFDSPGRVRRAVVSW